VAIGNQRRAQRTDALAHRAILIPYGVRLGEERLVQVLSRRTRLLGTLAHSLQGPVQIHRGGPRSTQSLTSFIDVL
jgi:hypothetical protein